MSFTIPQYNPQEEARKVARASDPHKKILAEIENEIREMASQGRTYITVSETPDEVDQDSWIYEELLERMPVLVMIPMGVDIYGDKQTRISWKPELNFTIKTKVDKEKLDKGIKFLVDRQ